MQSFHKVYSVNICDLSLQPKIQLEYKFVCFSEKEEVAFGNMIPGSCTFKATNSIFVFWVGLQHQTKSYI